MGGWTYWPSWSHQSRPAGDRADRQGGIDSAVEAMRAGANDFLVKPASPERIAVSIRNQLKIGTLSGEVKQLKKKQDNRLSFDDLVASSPEMKQVFRLGAPRRPVRHSVLIEGESGAGKELIARAIQGTSARAGKPFVTVNCGAIPENLIESILSAMRRAPSPAPATSIWQVPGSRWRHPVPGRDRRAAPGHAGQLLRACRKAKWTRWAPSVR